MSNNKDSKGKLDSNKKRLLKDVVDIMKHPLHNDGIHYFHDESNFQKAQSILLKKIEILQKKRKFNKLKITDITPKEVEKNNVEIH